jgi:hypothetical protein
VPSSVAWRQRAARELELAVFADRVARIAAVSVGAVLGAGAAGVATITGRLPLGTALAVTVMLVAVQAVLLRLVLRRPYRLGVRRRRRTMAELSAQLDGLHGLEYGQLLDRYLPSAPRPPRGDDLGAVYDWHVAQVVAEHLDSFALDEIDREAFTGMLDTWDAPVSELVAILASLR